MHKHIRTVCLSIAILFFVSIGVAAAAISKPFYTVKEGVQDGKIYAMILDDEVTELDLEQQMHLQLFNLLDGQDLGYIRPNTKGGGAYYIKNVSQYPIRYNMDITDENLLGIPLSFRLRDDRGDFLLGSENTWMDISALQNITGELQSGDQSLYSLEWMWDSSDNSDDTHIGIAARGAEPYTITVNVLSNPIGAVRSYGDPTDVRTDALSLLLAIVLTTGIVALTYITCVPNNKLRRALTKAK